MRQFVAIFCLCWSVLAALSQSAQGQSNTTNTTKSCIGKANKEKISAYVVLLRLRGTFTPSGKRWAYGRLSQKPTKLSLRTAKLRR
jgi:hypothetical protein